MGFKEKLNEWHFADNCLKEIEKDGKAVFKIVRRDRHPEYSFVGILRDRWGNVYEITDEESQNLFDRLIQIHHLLIDEDHTHTELVILPEST